MYSCNNYIVERLVINEEWGDIVARGGDILVSTTIYVDKTLKKSVQIFCVESGKYSMTSFISEAMKEKLDREKTKGEEV